MISELEGQFISARSANKNVMAYRIAIGLKSEKLSKDQEPDDEDFNVSETLEELTRVISVVSTLGFLDTSLPFGHLVFKGLGNRMPTIEDLKPNQRTVCKFLTDKGYQIVFEKQREGSSFLAKVHWRDI